MRKLVTCPKCGRANPQKRLTCTACDEKLPSPKDASAPKSEVHKLTACPACGDVGEVGQQSCVKCGFQMKVKSASQTSDSAESRQGFYSQPVETSYSENITETIADARYEAAKANPVARSEVFRNIFIVIALLAVLFFAARYCNYQI